MKQKIQKIWSTVSTVFVVLIACVAVFLLGVRLAGLKGFVVLSGSMEPEYPTGSVIYVKSADKDAMEVGDVITFYATGKTIATHRIIEVVEEDGVRLYRTKGDANEIADGSAVEPKDIIGTPLFCVPYLGFALSYIQSPPGIYVALAAGAWVLLIIFLPSLLFDKGNENKTRSKEEKQ